jgi:hypothetical protein
MRRLAGALALLAVGGCSDPKSCTVETMVHEIEYGSPFYDFQVRMLAQSRDTGWRCEQDGAIRNAWGQAVGMRYRCTICR